MAGDGHDHHHGSHHHTGHHGDEDFTEANRALWNKYASSYTSEQWQRDLLNRVTAFIHSNVNWIGVDLIDPSTTFEARDDAGQSDRSVRVLDYACGPGTVTHALAGRATEFVGMDLSENMVQAYNLRFNPETPSTSEGPDREDEALNARAVVGNLLTAQEPAASVSGPEYQGFDLVAVGMGYHHFADLQLATRRLADRLRPGGVFLIIDFVTHAMEKLPDAEVQAALNTVAHQGFSEAELKQIFEGAGLEDFALVRMGEEILLKGTMKREPFLARGRKT